MRFRAHWLSVLLPALLLSACDGTVFEPKGQQNYARLVTLGNSLTAGYLNGALIEGGQRAGYANLMSRSINGRDMSMPLVCDCPDARGIGLPDPGSPLPGMLYFDVETMSVTRDLYSPTFNPLSLLLNLTFAMPYENLGIPFAFAWDVLNATSADSSFAGLFAGRPNLFVDPVIRNDFLAGKATPLGQAARLAEASYAAPEVISIWIGNNDVLFGALAGEPELGVTVTPPQQIALLFAGIEQQVQAMGFPKVVVATIPAITSIPSVNTINPVAFVHPEAGPVRWNTEETDVEFILLSAQALLVVNGEPNPEYLPGGGSSLPPQLTLDAGEAAILDQAVTEYNAIIKDLAADNGWALADVNAGLAALPRDPTPETLGQVNGLYPVLPGIGLNPNSAFSLDGTHPSEKGYAMVAALFLQALNDTYGTDFPLPNAGDVANRLGFEGVPQGTPGAWGLTLEAAKGIQGAVGSPTEIWDELWTRMGGR